MATPEPPVSMNAARMKAETRALIRRVRAKAAEEAGHAGGEEHGDGNWIVSYADMMTLLCVFFVLMFSMSKPDVKKVEEMRKDTITAMGGKYVEPFSDLANKLRAIIAQSGLKDMVQIDSDENGVNATFRGTVFFDSGKADLVPAGIGILTQLGSVIKKDANGFHIIVEGHTDDEPITSATFPSNWELSGARASRVVRLFETLGFNRQLLTAIGYADTRPLLPNRDQQGHAIPANQAKNRRVVLRIQKDGPSYESKPQQAQNKAQQ